MTKSATTLSVADTKKIWTALKKAYPGARCSLMYESPFQLLVATILSAQCTDERVNRVTPVLFSKFPDAEAMAEARLIEIEKIIRPTGFFHNKAVALQECSRKIVLQHQGKVPDTMEGLVGLRGVGRKTANVVLGNAFGKQVGVVVDTHVGRLSRRMGLTRHLDPEKVEKDLVEKIPKSDWTLFSHVLIDHGRAICSARSPRCPECPIRNECKKIGVPSRLTRSPPGGD